MNKKIIALAVVAAFSAPAFAENANVTIYGKAFLTFDQAGTNATGGVSHMRVNTNASRFGVKGGEDLGGDIKATYQFEVEMDADGSTGLGLGKTRNSGVGIETGFGKVMLGVWDTPFKVAHNKIELFDNTSNWSATKTIGFNAGVDYNTRQKNMVQYWSPKFSDVQVAVLYSPDEAKTSTVNKSILSMSATFDKENIYASVAYENRNDATTTTKTDTALRAVGKFSLADFWVGAMVESMKANSTLTTSASGNNMEFVGGYKMGPNQFSASYAKAGSYAVGAAASNAISQLSLKYAYNFSKRTEVFAAYASRKTDLTTVADTSYVGGGIVHSF